MTQSTRFRPLKYEQLINNEQQSVLKRPKRIRIFCNGDLYHSGKHLQINPHRYMDFGDLLNELTQQLTNNINLPYGVRNIYTPVGGRKITSVEELQQNRSYVCGGFENFKPVSYGNKDVIQWSVTGKNKRNKHLLTNVNLNKIDLNKFAGFGGITSNNISQLHKTASRYGLQGKIFLQTNVNLNKPKNITIISNRPRPRRDVNILLNRKVVYSLQQLLKDISDSFGFKQNRIQKLFSMKGKSIKNISDLFLNDDVFIGVGSKDVLSHEDIDDILYEISSGHLSHLESEKLNQIALSNKFKNYSKDNISSGHLSHLESEKLNQVALSNKFKNYSKDKISSGHLSHLESEKLNQVALSDKFKNYSKDEKKKEKNMRADEPKRDSGLGSDDDSENPTDSKYLDKVSLDDIENKKHQYPHNISDRKEVPFKKWEDVNTKRTVKADNLKKKKDHEKFMLKKVDESEKRKYEPPPLASHEELRKIKKIPQQLNKYRVLEPITSANYDVCKEYINSAKDLNNDDAESEDYSDGKESLNTYGNRLADENHNKKDVSVKKNDDLLDKNNEELDKKDEHFEEKNENLEENDENLNHNDENFNKREENTKVLSKISESKINQSHKENEAVRRHSVTLKRDVSCLLNSDISQDENDEIVDDSDEENIIQCKERRERTLIFKNKMEREVSHIQHVFSKYEQGKVLGDGNFAVVSVCKLISSEKEFAMKVIDKSKLIGKESMIENEINVMKVCKHPNLIRLIEEFETATQIFLIMELGEGGDLFEFIIANTKFSERDTSLMINDVAKGVFYLHSRNIVHRDIKPENLLVHFVDDETIQVKLGDFGLATEVVEPLHIICGTPTYVAPEILGDVGYGITVDVWAIGIIAFILLGGYAPFRSPDRRQSELFAAIKLGVYEFSSPYWDNISAGAKDLISHLLVMDINERYKAIDVLCHSWIISEGSTIFLASDSIDDHQAKMRVDLEIEAENGKTDLIEKQNEMSKYIQV